MKKMMTVMILKTQKEQTEKLRNLNQRNYGPELFHKNFTRELHHVHVYPVWKFCISPLQRLKGLFY